MQLSQIVSFEVEEEVVEPHRIRYLKQSCGKRIFKLRMQQTRVLYLPTTIPLKKSFYVKFESHSTEQQAIYHISNNVFFIYLCKSVLLDQFFYINSYY